MWQPGWVQREPHEQVEALRPVVARPEWILDAVWSAHPAIWSWAARSESSPSTCRGTSACRGWCAVPPRGCSPASRSAVRTPSHWRQTFSRDSIIAWHFRSFAGKRETIAAWASDAGGPPVVRLTSRAQVDAWLRTLELAHS